MKKNAENRSGEFARRAVRVLGNPSRLVIGPWRRLPFGSFDLRCDLDLFPRPYYAYGVQQAALLAQRLGLPAVSIIEFGVAGGNGLVELERLARLASAATGVRIETYGFDRGKGLPDPIDYRDLPYTWRGGFFEMDIDLLKSRLTDAHLVLGDLADTVPHFFESAPAPVGFVAIDLDYYSSTVDALRLFEGDEAFLLPRVICYLDDIVGEDHVFQHDFVGELLAVHEFNDRNANRKIGRINALGQKRAVAAPWCESMFAVHLFEHPLYGKYVGPPREAQQLPL